MRKKHLLSMIIISLFTLVLFLPRGVFAEDITIITHPGIAPGSVDADTVKKIYSGHTTTWPDGTRIVVTTMTKAPFHGDFLKAYVGKTSSQFTATWKKLMFTGKGKFPTDFRTEGELIDFISNTPTAIGYVKAGSDLSGVSAQ